VVKTLHESVRHQIEKKNHVYATKAHKANMSSSPVIRFGYICVRRDIRTIENQSYNHEEMGHDNTYKVDLSGEYDVSATFNIYDLTLFDVGDDSRSNPNTKRNFRIRFLLVYLGLLKGDKSDSTIFRIIIFGFLLFLIFSS